MTSGDHWTAFWTRSGRDSDGQDAQSRVMRTENKQPISVDRWNSTVAYILDKFPINRDARLLDICAGNGLFSRQFAEQGATVHAIDISPDLLAAIPVDRYPKLSTQCADMRDLSFPQDEYSHIFLYAGIQYLTYAEAIELLRKCQKWLLPGGRMMIGDVPDQERLWHFYNNAERRNTYFTHAVKGEDIIGTWFEKSWLENLAEHAGFSSVVTQNQPPDQIYAHYRYDAFLTK
ncbi:MAG: class I SAM-dependent methyltransferase [Pseudomonadota bacterium]